ncbi:bifunctional nuclease family protein [Cryomorpha ignava]|uniref:Bifunctional nuclease family protein n=1 Tax=Cryomorpha ignava TaxID=101383 RepID=A0A7K3WSF3_9FLAO|nr:bifunctional nuclease family protein [Cryomorpha ignava]NEN24001.1 bifunctional nuclease family protein [Cryomorpha ignava]
MDKIELKVVGLSYSQTQTGAYALILKEKSGNRRLPIIIGGAEAQAIAIPLEKMTPSRPLTHDLFKSFLDSFDIVMHEVVIYNLVEGIFFAKIICSQGAKNLEIDARSSDAVAIALRCEKPIYTHDFILGSAGIIIDEEDEGAEDETSNFSMEEVSELDAGEADTLADLEKQLELALEREDYEKASKLRDELKKRKKK